MDDLPYGKRSSEAGVMNAKFQGIRPFDVPKEIQQLWPEDVLEIMVHCCSSHRDLRPSMGDVDDCLQECYCGQLLGKVTQQGKYQDCS